MSDEKLNSQAQVVPNIFKSFPITVSGFTFKLHEIKNSVSHRSGQMSGARWPHVTGDHDAGRLAQEWPVPV